MTRRFALLTSTLLGLVVGAFALTVVMLSPVQAQPDDDYITIVKGPDQVIVYESMASFNITVTSTYTGDLTNVIVSDPLSPDCDEDIGILTAGNSYYYSCSLNGVTADFTNIATVSGEIPGTNVIFVGDTDVATVDVIDPSIVITKTPDLQTVSSGYTATFDIVVTNTGDADLTDVTVTDDEAPDCDRVFANLSDGQSENYSCSVGPVTTPFTNEADVIGTPPAGPDVTDSDSAYVEVIYPDIAIAKTPDVQLAVWGDTVEFSIAVTNTGDVPLSNVTVTDAEAPDCDRIVGGLISGPGGNSTYTCNVVVTGDMLNTAVVTGTPPVGPDVSANDSAFVDVVAPEVSINKTDDIQTVNSDNQADFTITVENTGEADLTNVTVTDPESPACDNVLANLSIDQVWEYSCNSDPVTEGFINIATVSGEPTVGEDVTDADSARVTLAETQAACPTDMFAYWMLDESGGNVYDDYYTGYDAVCDGACPTATESGVINGAQTFNGNDTALSVSPVPGVPAAQFNWVEGDSFSIELWMQTGPDACTDNDVIIGRVAAGNSNGAQWWVGCWDGGQAAFVLIDRAGNGPEHFMYGSADLTADDEWHHIVAIRDASASEIRLYVDGVLEDWSEAADYTNFVFTGNAVNIGWIDFPEQYHFTGSVDEIALYDRVLSSTEIFQHYNEGQVNQQWYCAPDVLFPPTIVSTPVTEASVQRPYTYDVESIGDPTPVYTLTLNPSGMTIDPIMGLISWKPVVAQQGSHSVTVEASNDEGTDPQSFDIEVLQGPICPVSMISYWKLDEETPGVYADFYDGNDAICEAGQCPAPTTLVRVNRAQAFGSDDQLNVPADESFDWSVDDSLSIEFWMHSLAPCDGENQVIVGRDDAATDLHWWVGCQGVGGGGGEATFVLIDSDGQDPVPTLSGTTAIDNGAWHHVVATRDAIANEIYLYVDGELEDSMSATYSAGFDSAAAELNIGWLNLPGGYHFQGVIDEVALYDTALDPTEIQQHYDRGLEGGGYCISPEIGIAKAADPMTAYAGTLITYTYTLTNPGDDPLSGVDVTDDKCDSVDYVEGDSDTDNKLDLSETWTYTCSMTLGQDTTNVAIAEATFSLNDVVSDTATAFVNIINPDIAIDKQVNAAVINTGDTVTYTFVVTNPGDDPLSDVSVTDALCAPEEILGGDGNLDDKLDPDETWTYTCSMILSADTINTVIVTGTDSLGNVIDDMDTVSVNVINPDINIDKQVNPGVIYAGDRVTYTYTVTNPQDEPLSNVVVSDDPCDPVTFVGGDDNPDNDNLDPDETWTYTCSTELFTDTINVATVIANDPLSGVVSDTAMALVDVINPNISVDKWANSTTIYAGDMVTYTYSVVNPGDDPLSSVDISDDLCSPVAFVGGDNDQNDKLDSGETWIHTCSMTLSVDTTNTAIVTGTDSLNGVVSDTATLSIDVINPDISLDKQANPEMVYAGETVTYTYTVNNLQDNALIDVSVSDDRCSEVSFVGGDDDLNDELGQEETWTFICSMALFSDTTNLATVVGTGPLNDVVSDTDTAFVDVINPDISIDKQANSVAVGAGDAVTYTYTVINSGDDVLSNVSISDDQCSPVALVAGDDNLNDTLDLQETWTYTCVTELLTNTTNVAIVTAVDSLDGIVSDTDTVTVLVSEVWYPLYLPIVLSNASALR